MDFYALTDTGESDFTAEERDHIFNLCNKYSQYDSAQIAYIVLNVILQGSDDRPSHKRLKTKLNNLLRQLANKGIAEYQTLLGDKLIYRQISPVNGASNSSEAKKWYEKALEKKDARAAWMLGLLYEGRYSGVNRDLELSAKYYQKAKELGYRV